MKTVKKITRLLPLLICMALLAGIGVAYLWTSHAATPFVSVEAEKGTIKAPASAVADSSASGGNAVKFSAASSSNKPIQLSQPFYNYANAAINAYNSATDATTKNQLWQIAATPGSIWLGVDQDQTHFTNKVSSIATAAAQAHQTPVFTLYAVPYRDCGSYSAGGFQTKAEYEAWIDWFTAGLGNKPAIVIVEPDGIGLCGTDQQKADRIAELKYALDNIQTRDPNAYAYIHAGSGELSISGAVNVLMQIDIKKVRGFAMNVSSFGTNAEQISYGNQLASALATAGAPNMHYVIDTSRNGLGRDTSGNGGQPEWCNPPGRALGVRPTTDTGNSLVDAFLWIKIPGGSDGNCHTGDPTAGQFFTSYATGLVQRALDNHIVTDLPNGTYYTGN